MSKLFRLLLPWFEEETAVQLLVGASPTPERLRAAHTRWQAAAAKIAERHIEAPKATTWPLPERLQTHAKRFARETKFRSVPGFADAELRLVELTSILTFQAKVANDASSRRIVEGRDPTPETVFDICLPTQPTIAPVRVITEGSSAMIVSENPNLQLGGFQLNGNSLTIQFGFRPPWVQVVEYRGRLFIRNGYHRCRALLTTGSRFAVAVVVQARSFAELGADKPGFIGEAQLLGDAPPFLADFEDPVLCAGLTEPDSEHVITITATESAQVPSASLRSAEDTFRRRQAAGEGGWVG